MSTAVDGADGQRRVVVGIDGSSVDRPVLIRAAAQARAHGATLEVLAVWNHLPKAAGIRLSPAEWIPDSVDQVIETCRAVAAESVSDALGPDLVGRVDVDLRVVRGIPTNELLDAARNSDLLVVGRRDSSRLRHTFLGSVADQCVRHAPCPVMVVPETPMREDRDAPVVVGVDGSPASLKALSWAIEQGRRSGHEVRAVYCWIESALDFASTNVEAPGLEQAADVAADQLDSWIAAAGVGDDVTVTPALRWGHQSEVLPAAADSAAMLVVGSRGLGGFAGLVLGSVSREMVHTARCPVVVLHP